MTGSSIELDTKTGNTEIYYTLKGTTVNNAEKLYTAPISPSEKAEFPYTIEAYAKDKDGILPNSEKTEFTYTRQPENTLPVIASPNSGKVSVGTEVRLSSTTSYSVIIYMLNSGEEITYSDSTPIKLNTLPPLLLPTRTPPEITTAKK